MRQSFISRNAFSASGVHWNWFFFMQLRKVLMNGKDFAAWLARNRLSAANRPASFCMSLMFAGEGILSMAWTFSGFTLKPSLVTMKPKNFPSSIPNEHFARFSLMLTLRSVLKVFWIFASIALSSLLMITRSSMYTSMYLPMASLNVSFINRWYVAPAFFKPNGILV
ncbi:hypothetical protein HanRHA438_Chr07g0317011 [Helianthus annuus]|nr:hypothetical protein HanIR_Chr07g0332461 [Helianthus annuus]KAJ0909026.1 hypothetical protein HanRHA438_Chr07g0317011 [Helianthus annuus]